MTKTDYKTAQNSHFKGILSAFYTINDILYSYILKGKMITLKDKE